MDKKPQNRRRRDNKRIHFQIKKKNDTQHNKINATKKKKKIPSTQKMTSNPSQNMYELLIGENILSIGDKKNLIVI